MDNLKQKISEVLIIVKESLKQKFQVQMAEMEANLLKKTQSDS